VVALVLGDQTGIIFQIQRQAVSSMHMDVPSILN
jgi:hypothetical protein